MIRVSGDWLTRPATQAVLSMLADAGHQAWLVGGCVRNALLGEPVGDIDIATDARPETVLALADKAGLKAVPTGIDHGTVTVIADGIPHEVTTFRADVETDGRHAVVRFSDRLEDDAQRRDFTMNALYASADGDVRDPVGGLPDLARRRFRFIGDADTRIREDYLRVLRYFRFQAWYGDPAAGFDPQALDAVARNIDGLAGLSRERVGQEILKLLSARDPGPAVAVMERTGVLQAVLPGAIARTLPVLVHLESESGTAPDPVRRLAALGVTDGESLRLSRTQQRALEQLHAAVSDGRSAAALGYLLGESAARDVILLRAAALETPPDPDAFEQVRFGAAQIFPVRAADLPHLQGRALGETLRRLKEDWIASGFALGRAELLNKA